MVEVISDVSENSEEVQIQYPDVEVNMTEVQNNLKLKDIQPDEEEVKKEKKKVRMSKKDKAEVESPDLTQDLYAEFSAFLKAKADISPDVSVKQLIPTGIDILDAILGGGFAAGALAVIVGAPGSGKSMLADQTLGNAQKLYKGKLLGAVLDSEEATTKLRLAQLGVRYPMIDPYNDITIEKVFKFLEGICLFKEEKGITDPSVVIWDSVANTLSEKEREAEELKNVIGYKPKLLSLLIPKYIAKCAKNNICLIAINQLRDLIQMGLYPVAKDLKFMSSQKDMPGGNSLKFNAFHLIEMKVKSVVDREKYGFDGVISSLKCVKNKLFTPNIDIAIVGSFVEGFSNFWTNFEFLKDSKRLTTGAWNYLVNLPDVKFRTKDALATYNENADFKAAWDNSVKDAIKTEIIDKYTVTIEE
jgi:RecA/RadA recombinase